MWSNPQHELLQAGKIHFSFQKKKEKTKIIIITRKDTKLNVPTLQISTSRTGTAAYGEQMQCKIKYRL
jgi:hypothetical protein